VPVATPGGLKDKFIGGIEKPPARRIHAETTPFKKIIDMKQSVETTAEKDKKTIPVVKKSEAVSIETISKPSARQKEKTEPAPVTRVVVINEEKNVSSVPPSPSSPSLAEKSGIQVSSHLPSSSVSVTGSDAPAKDNGELARRHADYESLLEEALQRKVDGILGSRLATVRVLVVLDLQARTSGAKNSIMLASQTNGRAAPLVKTLPPAPVKHYKVIINYPPELSDEKKEILKKAISESMGIDTSRGDIIEFNLYKQ